MPRCAMSWTKRCRCNSSIFLHAISLALKWRRWRRDQGMCTTAQIQRGVSAQQPARPLLYIVELNKRQRACFGATAREADNGCAPSVAWTRSAAGSRAPAHHAAPSTGERAVCGALVGVGMLHNKPDVTCCMVCFRGAGVGHCTAGRRHRADSSRVGGGVCAGWVVRGGADSSVHCRRATGGGGSPEDDHMPLPPCLIP
jgi:hypothetical protein